MFGKKKAENEKLDLLAKELLQASALTNLEAETALSPFLYQRMREKIAQTELVGYQSVSPLSMGIGLLLAARRALPSMALVALIAICGFWMGADEANISKSLLDDSSNMGSPYLSASVAACSLSSASTAQECIVSDNDVLTIIFSEDTEAQK
jgi:hypothetical protein